MKGHEILIGTSGWSYKHWRNTFYPEDLKIKDQFEYYQRFFNTVEINNTFYRVPEKSTFLKWKSAVPPGFRYVIKANRFITHMKKLHDPGESLSDFLGRAELLEEKLGAILFQLPPGLKANFLLLKEFLRLLPRGNRYVFEFRNPDWYKKEIYSLLEENNCGFCIYELAGHLSPEEITADFVYLRLHGPGNKYQGSYSDETLSEWSAKCRKWLKKKDVFVYFDNDEKGYAAFNAIKLKSLMEGK
jgi:uncharacterized protein YecE (DUF72 family)